MTLRIKEVIKEKGLTVKEVADRLGMSSPSLSDAINGNPTAEKIERIAEAIGVPASELFEPRELIGVVSFHGNAYIISTIEDVENFLLLAKETLAKKGRACQSRD
jgi:transcriptional regulator with XRE-family HTH domain